jgi:hypothetical protein
MRSSSDRTFGELVRRRRGALAPWTRWTNRFGAPRRELSFERPVPVARGVLHAGKHPTATSCKRHGERTRVRAWTSAVAEAASGPARSAKIARWLFRADRSTGPRTLRPRGAAENQATTERWAATWRRIRARHLVLAQQPTRATPSRAVMHLQRTCLLDYCKAPRHRVPLTSCSSDADNGTPPATLQHIVSGAPEQNVVRLQRLRGCRLLSRAFRSRSSTTRPERARLVALLFVNEDLAVEASTTAAALEECFCRFFFFFRGLRRNKRRRMSSRRGQPRRPAPRYVRGETSPGSY